MGEPTAEQDASKFRAVFEAAVDGILTIDGAGLVESLNPAAERMFGYSADELVGQNVKVLMPPPYHDEHDGYLRHYLATGEKRVIGLGREVTGRRKDGSLFPMYLSVAEVTLEEGRRFAGIVRDISVEVQLREAREALIEKLEQTNAELERFTYTVSHDLKSPLITIKGFLGGLEKDARAGNFERLASDVARISRAADQMKQLLDDLLELSRIGRIVAPAVRVPLGELVAETLALLAGPIAEKQAVVLVDDALPDVFGDRTRLREVLQNLVENALKFAIPGEPPRIQVGVLERRGRHVTCFVRDEGVGIAPEHATKIFGLFERLDQKAEGTGVGLALAKRIVAHHGGEIWVESPESEQGSTFFFTLPLPD
ncbi:MAG: PAS domain S-box protein [Myxococcales bacterium]|nr:PAS domain S-box protein [Myxococcales bacterium]